jgi:general secretion pathway protein D
MKSIPIILVSVLCFGLFAPGLSAQEHYEIIVDQDYYYLQFDETSGVPIEEFIDLCKEITDYPIKYTKQEVDQQSILILGVQRVGREKKKFFEYFQAVMISYDFICSSYGPQEKPYFYTVQKLSAAGQRTNQVQSQAPVVARENLAEFKDNPGMLITTTIPLRYIAAREMFQSLSNMVQQGGMSLESIRAVDNANSLVITTFATKVWGINKLVELMDVPPFEPDVNFDQRELLYAVADELEPVLTNLIQAKQNQRTGQPQSRVQGVLKEPEPKIIAEPRTNSLLFTGNKKDVDMINDWITLLDVEVDPRGDIHVYRLKNTLAKSMEEVLKSVIEGQQQGGQARPTGAGGGVQPGSLEAPSHVVADEPSNSLIITASKTKYAQLLEVIKEIDLRRRQVLIDCAAVELTERIDEALGIELAGLDLKLDADGNMISDNYTRPFGFSSFGLSEFTNDPDTGFPNQRIPTIGTGLTGGIFNGQDFAIPFLLQALAKNQNANILSMPSVLTNDNEQALITATDEQPTFTTSQGNVSDQTSFNDYEKAGITLTISPSISAGNYLKLYVKIEVSSFDEASTLSPPPKSTREIETHVTIPDGHTMIVGGVLTDNTTKAVSKIPILGDIPLIGWLFRSSSETTRKVNLYVFITPHIIGDDFANLDEISSQKKNEVELLTGKVKLIDPDFEYTEFDNIDRRVIEASANWIFEIPSYAAPETGEVKMEYVTSPEKEEEKEGEQ